MKMRTENRTPAHNRRLAKVAVQCSVDTFPAMAGQVVVNQTLVLRINICGENRHLRQAPNRYRKPYKTDSATIKRQKNSK